MSQFLLLLGLFTVLKEKAAAGLGGGRKAIKCYSCASSSYGELWHELGYDKIYAKPADFTKYCNNPRRGQQRRALQTVECFTTCVSIEDRLKAAGGSLSLHFRGCYDNFFASSAIQQRTDALLLKLAGSDGSYNCANISLAGLNVYRSDAESSEDAENGDANDYSIQASAGNAEDTVKLCSCALDFCNGARSKASARVLSAHKHVIHTISSVWLLVLFVQSYDLLAF